MHYPDFHELGPQNQGDEEPQPGTSGLQATVSLTRTDDIDNNNDDDDYYADGDDDDEVEIDDIEEELELYPMWRVTLMKKSRKQA